MQPCPFDAFRAALAGPDPLETVRRGLIGADAVFDGPFGPRPLLYADYVASGRALRQVESFVMEEVLPWYANSHTEASHCGMTMTRMREAARRVVARAVNAGPDCHVVFAGSGATAGINRIVRLLDVEGLVRTGRHVRVLTGPYEHHSNILPWRESGAEVVEIPEAAGGGVDLEALEAALKDASGADLVVGAFSAASNVTGVLADVDAVTRTIKAHGALAIWDYAGGGPYLPMDMGDGAAAKDAIVLSPHKFPGGPGASGLLIVRDTVARRETPTAPGGGTVSFVSPWRHAYSASLSAREEAGTPNVVGDIRAALVLLVKEAIGTETIGVRDAALRALAHAAWRDVPGLDLLGPGESPKALPIFAFRVRGTDGAPVHHQLVTRILSDVHGIQARGGCACAGPYAHRLLGIDREASDALFDRLSAGHELEKPGWVRLNLSYLHTDAEADRILAGVADIARTASRWAAHYDADPATARFRARTPAPALAAEA
ncbi:aminotransferase class V-fold PLP-dependent enzyme [Futiania mangrovi]|uniref:Aminotransferase class V-fold PLP-dependent enzyme n=1 Tax=Futiania mangrovi TaxID=2959716 RepID=A0A9J6P945_9PROT|nr:aminotransferase class V-fold PLP-dependent enzyme [Futiania mangrovii]MCP1335293.1 aminotransferase class V-fold PLP-dependent enzyme [Futiania mangrovii]